jgi:hypothetical protein
MDSKVVVTFLRLLAARLGLPCRRDTDSYTITVGRACMDVR